MSTPARVTMTAPEAAQTLGMDVTYVRRLVRAKRLPGRKVSDGSYRIPARAVYHLRATRTNATEAAR